MHLYAARMQKLLTKLPAISNKWRSIAKPEKRTMQRKPVPLIVVPLLCDYSIHIHRGAIQKLFNRSATFVYRVKKELLAIFAQEM